MAAGGSGRRRHDWVVGSSGMMMQEAEDGSDDLGNGHGNHQQASVHDDSGREGHRKQRMWVSGDRFQRGRGRWRRSLCAAEGWPADREDIIVA
ncbi:hypothetical protein BHE74_00035124 [Ensete ventricosum]|nr:hypothetical protein GW17_00060828 [Ensete ventricosum]RWW58043.1 hypothetical protein BHE74_00035124 [Ensete ventricosum]RZS02916.1 hypothetical protein BHM03_00033019 [Ensete ventricosum]